jgi:beta-glucosidase
LSRPERVLKALEAGIDQFGGEACPEEVVELVRGGRLAESRIDVSERRLLRDKFRLGLFDHPYVDAEAAEAIVGQPRFQEAGALAQRRSIVLLKNGALSGAPALPLRGRPKLYVEGLAPEAARHDAEVVAMVEEAEVALLRLSAPYEPRDTYPLESFFHAGDLSFGAEELARILDIAGRVPTIVAIYLDRPAVIPEIAGRSAALLADFGASDAALLDVVCGRFRPEGKLPFELPASMEAVRRQKPDLPYDSGDPLFPFGHGLTY